MICLSNNSSSIYRNNIHRKHDTFHAEKSVRAKISHTAKVCFDSLKFFFAFPLRYFGSKTWSIPGIIFRTPIILFKRVFGLSRLPLKDELFGTGYHFNFEKTLTPDELKPFYHVGCAAAYIYKRNANYVPPGWTVVSTNQLKFSHSTIEMNDECFTDPITGFKAVIFEKDSEFLLCFGTIEEDSHQRQKKIGVAKTFAGGGGLKVFQLADDFVQSIRKNPYFQGKTITLSGQCYGGAMASYVAIKQEIPAVCLNTFPLGVGQQSDLGSKKLKNADKYVTHISSSMDYTSDFPILPLFDRVINAIGIRTLGNFGRRFKIPSIYKHPIKSHLYILSSMNKHLGLHERALPIAVGRDKASSEARISAKVAHLNSRSRG